MTNEQFNTLARYDEEIRIAATRRWARVPSRSALKEIHDTLLAISGPRPRLNPLCHACVLRQTLPPRKGTPRSRSTSDAGSGGKGRESCCGSGADGHGKPGNGRETSGQTQTHAQAESP